MTALRRVWRQHRAYLAFRRSLAAQRACCGGMCTTADRAQDLNRTLRSR